MVAKRRKPPINWMEKFIEILVVVIGVTLAFVVNRSYENYKNEQAAHLYMSGLQDDLKTDLEKLDSLLSILDHQKQELERLVGYLSTHQMEQDSFAILLQTLTHLNFFEMRQSSFKSLQSSGQVTLISDFQLRKKLFDYYHRAGGLQTMQRELEEYFNRFIVPLLLDKVDMKKGEMLDQVYFKSIQFRNVVLGYWSLLKQQKAFYRSIRNRAIDLTQHLDQNLKE